MKAIIWKQKLTNRDYYQLSCINVSRYQSMDNVDNDQDGVTVKLR